MARLYELDPNFVLSNCTLGRKSPVVTRSMRNISKNEILAKVFCSTPKEIQRPNYFESELSEDEQMQERNRRKHKLVRRRSVSAICRRNKEPLESTDTNDYSNPLNTPKKLLKRRYTLGAVLSDREELCLSNGTGNFHMYNSNDASLPNQTSQSNSLPLQDEVTEILCAFSGNNPENIQDNIDTVQTNSHKSRARERMPVKVKFSNNELSRNVNQHSKSSLTNTHILSNKIPVMKTKKEIVSSTEHNSDRVKDIISNSKSRNNIKTKNDSENPGIVHKSSIQCGLELGCIENLSKKRRSRTPNKYCCDTNNHDRRKVPQSRARCKQSPNYKSSIETGNKVGMEQIYIDQVQKTTDISGASLKTPNKMKPNKVIETTNTLNSDMKSKMSDLLLKATVDLKQKTNQSNRSPKKKSKKSVEVDAKAIIIQNKHSKPTNKDNTKKYPISGFVSPVSTKDLDYNLCRMGSKRGSDRIDKEPSLKEESGNNKNVSKPTEGSRSASLCKKEEKQRQSSRTKDVSKNNKADFDSKHHHRSRSGHKDYTATSSNKDREQTKSSKSRSEDRVVSKYNKLASRENEKRDKNKNTKHSDHSSSRKEDKHKSSERTKHQSSSTSNSRDVQSEVKDTEKMLEKNEVKRSYSKRSNEENMRKSKTAVDKERSERSKAKPSTPDIDKIKKKSVSDKTRHKCSKNPNKKTEVESKRIMDMSTDTTDNLPELIPIDNVELAFLNINNPTPQSLPTLQYTQGVNIQGDIPIEVIAPYSEALKRNLPHDLKISLRPLYSSENHHLAESMSKNVQTSFVYPGISQITQSERPSENPPISTGRIGNAPTPRRHSYCADVKSRQPVQESKQLPVCQLSNQSDRKPASNNQLTYLDRDPRRIAKITRSARSAPYESVQENVIRGASTNQNLAEVQVAAPQKDVPPMRGAFTVNEWEFARKFCENIQNYMERTPEEQLASMFEVSNLDNDSTEDLIQILADNAPVEALTDTIPSVVTDETFALDDFENKAPIGTDPNDMQHYKKRLIHQMESHPTSSVSEADSDRLYPTATSKGPHLSSNEQEGSKKESVQSKSTRRRSVCRSKYRHTSLELFKLGNSISTSLCKSRESYTVSAEKNLQMCQQQNGRSHDEPTTSVSITDQIIQSIDTSRKKDMLQRSTSVQSDKSTDSNSNSIETPKVPGRHQLPPIISDIPERSKSRTSSSNPPVEPRLNGQRTKSAAEPSLPDFAPRKKIASRRQAVISTENINCERTTMITSQDSPINLSVKKKDTESLPHPTPNYPKTVYAQNTTFPQIEQQINRLETMNEYRVEDFRNNITMSIIKMVRSVMQEDNFNAQVVLILSEWFKELRRVLYTTTTSQQTKDKVIEVLNEVVDFLCRHIFGPKYPCKYKALVEEFIQYKLQEHADILGEKLSLLSKTDDRYQWMLRLMKILKGCTFDDTPIVDGNIRRASTGGNTQMDAVKGNALSIQIPPAHKPQKTPKKVVEIRRNDSDRRSVNVARVVGDERIVMVPPNIQRKHVREPPVVVLPQNTEVQLDVIVPRGNTVLEQTVEVRDTSMEVTKETANASNTTAVNDDVVLVRMHEAKESKEDVKDFKFDLKELQQMYMQTTSRKKLRQLIQIIREEDCEFYQKVMEKFSAATDLRVKEIITIDDEEDTASGESNPLSEPDNAVIVISPERAGSVDADVSPPKKLRISTETTLTNTQTNPNRDKDLNQNYISGKQSVIVQQNKNESHTAPPQPSLPCVIEDISSEEDTTSRPFCELFDPPQQPDAYMDVCKSTRNIIYAKAMPSQPPPAIPSCSQTPPHLPFYKPRANEKPMTMLDNVITQSFPPTPEALSPTSPVPSKSYVSWRSWMSDERCKNFFGMNMSPTSRNQSLETINSIGSDYSPKFILDNNMVDVKLDSKWYRITKRLYDRIPKGKMCYIRANNTFVRYFDDAQMQKFVSNMCPTNSSTPDLLKQMKCRTLESSIKNEVIHIAKNVTFCPNDKINDPEVYVHEVQKVQKYLPIDFYGFYKFVTGYQIINNHAPISFQTFLIMHNTNGMRKLFNKYVRSLIEGWIVV